MSANPIHEYLVHALKTDSSEFLASPYDELKVGDHFRGSYPTTWAQGDIESIHDAKLYRIFTIRTDADVLVTARMRHETKGEGWIVSDPARLEELTDAQKV